MTVEDRRGRRGSQKGHRPTFTRAHTKDEIEKIRQAHIDKPLSIPHADSISRGMMEYWKRRKAREVQEAQNANGEVTIFTPDTNNG